MRVVAGVIRRGERCLVCTRPHHKRHGGLWEFPGGKLRPGENDAAGLERELQEELGVALTASESAVLELQDEGSAFIIAFVPACIDGAPQPTEHSDVRWATLAELTSMPLAPSDAQFVNWLAECMESGPS